MAKAAAPFCHSRLSSVEHSGEISRPTVIRAPAVSATLDEWQAEYVPVQRRSTDGGWRESRHCVHDRVGAAKRAANGPALCCVYKVTYRGGSFNDKRSGTAPAHEPALLRSIVARFNHAL
jgi:hypothetical protein